MRETPQGVIVSRSERIGERSHASPERALRCLLSGPFFIEQNPEGTARDGARDPIAHENPLIPHTPNPTRNRAETSVGRSPRRLR